MPTVSSTDGSPTNTCWKRRSSAASFSMYLRYSSSVVAPTRRSSPRASIGLIMLPASIARFAGRAGADDGVQLVDEGDDLPGGVLDVVEDGLEPLLEFAAVLGARDHRTQVQADDGLVAQAFRDVASDDALGQALHDRGLTDAGLADQHRVVLGATAQHLDDATNLVVPSDDWVELALAGPRRQVGGVLLQRLVGRFGVGAGDPRAAAHIDERFPQCLRRRAVSGEQLGDFGVTGGQTDHQVLGGDVFVVHLGG